MVPEIPIPSRQIFNVRSHTYESATRLETAMNLSQGSVQITLCAEMLEKVTAKDHIKTAVAKGPFCATILFDKVNVWRKSLARFYIQIHSVFQGSIDLIDQFAPVKP